jgi:hypothetical protein
MAVLDDTVLMFLLKTACANRKESGPVIRTRAMAPIPGAVESAQMVSSLSIVRENTLMNADDG